MFVPQEDKVFCDLEGYQEKKPMEYDRYNKTDEPALRTREERDNQVTSTTDDNIKEDRVTTRGKQKL